MSKLTHVKWIGPNDPMICILRNNARLYITKRELVELAREIDSFVGFYPDQFSGEQLDIETPVEDEMEITFENFRNDK